MKGMANNQLPFSFHTLPLPSAPYPLADAGGQVLSGLLVREVNQQDLPNAISALLQSSTLLREWIQTQNTARQELRPLN